ncbi:hypothetical protein [Parafrankia sp. FMc2]|uniref:hypothetical protein n=1 Tax=Parafrankia sp. FMc2 TaxID=3233196 RepID=UPI0034D4CDFD
MFRAIPDLEHPGLDLSRSLFDLLPPSRRPLRSPRPADSRQGHIDQIDLAEIRFREVIQGELKAAGRIREGVSVVAAMVKIIFDREGEAAGLLQSMGADTGTSQVEGTSEGEVKGSDEVGTADTLVGDVLGVGEVEGTGEGQRECESEVESFGKLEVEGLLAGVAARQVDTAGAGEVKGTNEGENADTGEGEIVSEGEIEREGEIEGSGDPQHRGKTGDRRITAEGKSISGRKRPQQARRRTHAALQLTLASGSSRGLRSPSDQPGTRNDRGQAGSQIQNSADGVLDRVTSSRQQRVT